MKTPLPQRLYRTGWVIALVALAAVGALRTLQSGESYMIRDAGPNASSNTVLAAMSGDSALGAKLREVLTYAETDQPILAVAPLNGRPNLMLDQVLAFEAVPRPFKLRELDNGQTLMPDDPDVQKSKIIFFCDMEPPPGFPPAKVLFRRMSFLIR